MANEINKPRCGEKTGNTGIPSCDFNPGRAIGIILHKKGQEFFEEDIVDLIETLKKKAQGPISERVFPIFHFGTITDNSTEPTSENLGVGFDRYLNEGAYNVTYILVNGTLCYVKSIRNFNGDKYNGFLVLDNGLYGVKTKNGSLRGFTMSQFYVPKYTFATDSTSSRFNVNLVFPKPEEFMDSYFYIDTEDDIEYEIKGILEYNAIIKSATVDKIAIDIVNKCSQSSILDIYGEELADAELWKGATAVAFEDGLLSLTGTFVNGQKIIPPSVTALAEKNIGGSPEYGIEILPFTIKLS